MVGLEQETAVMPRGLGVTGPGRTPAERIGSPQSQSMLGVNLLALKWFEY